jgi:hypothetical protein
MKFDKITRFFTVFDAMLQPGVVISGCAETSERRDGGESKAALP